ncbi:MAG TPA: MATE family efflux transporter [Rikenellaceae bacterium]|nr:MATE family efflux transporter [Rikenellaceae bacterium]
MAEYSLQSDALLSMIRNGQSMTRGLKVSLAVRLSIPAIIAQLSAIIMQYIDASMVGSLGAEGSAAVGLVSTTTWLFTGTCSAVAAGFTVQVAHKIGSNDWYGARNVLRQGISSTLIFSIILASIGVLISSRLPIWLGGDESIRSDASAYFMIFASFMPAMQLNYLAGGMLRCSGNMRIPSLVGVLMCVLDVLFNFFLIFPTRLYTFAGISMTIPGAGMGVKGAALGTAAAAGSAAAILLIYLWRHSGDLRPGIEKASFIPNRSVLRKALKISIPMALEHIVICGAQIMTTVIVAPLGVFALAANSLAVTAESLCYMPGYGIADAATTLVGQSVGARQRELARSFGRITLLIGMSVMGVAGVLMFLFAPQIIGIMTPVSEVRELGVMALRIEAFAEPMFAASIVAYGVFVGAADTIIPCTMNFLSIWAVRLTLAALLAPSLGLKGVWIAMCIELCFRGIIFLIRFKREKWLKI